MPRFEGATRATAKGVTVGETVTIPQGATMLEKPEGTVRDWVRKGLVRANQDTRGRWLIDRDSLIAHASTKATVTPSTRSKSQTQATATPSVEGDSRYIRTLEDSLAREQRLNDELRAKNDSLQGELLKLTAELKAILTKEDKGILSRWRRG